MFIDLDHSSQETPMATPRRIVHPVAYETPQMAVPACEAQTEVEKHLGLIKKIRSVHLSNLVVPVGIQATISEFFISQLSGYLPKLSYPDAFFVGAILTGAASAIVAAKGDIDSQIIARYIEQNPQLERTNPLLLEQAESLAQDYLDDSSPVVRAANNRWNKYV